MPILGIIKQDCDFGSKVKCCFYSKQFTLLFNNSELIQNNYRRIMQPTTALYSSITRYTYTKTQTSSGISKMRMMYQTTTMGIKKINKLILHALTSSKYLIMMMEYACLTTPTSINFKEKTV